jgi:signal transduction histidine kinase/FixJ family two-component response regulator
MKHEPRLLRSARNRRGTDAAIVRHPDVDNEPRMLDSALHWRYFVAVGAFLLLLVVAAGWYSQHLTARLSASLAKGESLRTTLEESRKFLGYVVDLESGHRGYLLTGDPRQLEAFRVAEAALPRQLELLERLLAERVELTELLGRMRHTLIRKRDAMATLKTQVGPLEPQAQTQIPADEDLGKFEMDQLRLSTQALEQVVYGMLAKQRQQVAADMEARSMAMNTALIISAIIIIIAMLLGALHFDALRRQEQLRFMAQRSRSESDAKSTFLAHVSHEIRTPMNAIFGFGGLLHDRLEDATNRRYIDAITESARSLLGLINDLLDLSTIESGRIEIACVPSRPRDIVEGVITMMSQQAESMGVKLVADVHSQVPPVLNIDGGRLRQMLVNLVGNALKHTRTGEIIVRVKAGPGSSADTVSCLFEVEDHGCGIPAEDLERVFEPFALNHHQRDAGVSGTGLGLSITRQLARAMGGDVHARSALGQGSCFTISLPDLKTSVETWHATSSTRRLRDLPPQKMLIVEDEQLNRQVLAAMFADSPHEVRMAGNAVEALDLIRDWIPEVALLDLHLPGMNGIELTERLRSDPRLRSTRMVAVTASSYYPLPDVSPHFDGVVVKPFYEVTLVRALEAACSPDRILTDDGDALAAHDEMSELLAPNLKLIAELDRLLDEGWPGVRDTPTVGEVRTFAGVVEDIGSRNRSRAVIQYARKLGGAAASFDIARIEALLAEFPAHVAEQRARLSSALGSLKHAGQ